MESKIWVNGGCTGSIWDKEEIPGEAKEYFKTIIMVYSGLLITGRYAHSSHFFDPFVLPGGFFNLKTEAAT